MKNVIKKIFLNTCTIINNSVFPKKSDNKEGNITKKDANNNNTTNHNNDDSDNFDDIETADVVGGDDNSSSDFSYDDDNSPPPLPQYYLEKDIAHLSTYKKKESPTPDECTLCVGDIHGNTAKFIWTLTYLGVVDITNEKYEEIAKAWSNFPVDIDQFLDVNCGNKFFQPSGEIEEKEREKRKELKKIELKKIMEDFLRSIKKMKISPKDITYKQGGDLYGDRGKNDWATMAVIKFLLDQLKEIKSEQKPKIVFIAGNHELKLFKLIYNIFHPKEQIPIPNSSDCRSVKQLESLIKNGLIKEEEVTSFFFEYYLPNVKIADYEEETEENPFCYCTHAPITPGQLLMAAEEMKINIDKLPLKKAIEEINSKFREALFDLKNDIPYFKKYPWMSFLKDESIPSHLSNVVWQRYSSEDGTPNLRDYLRSVKHDKKLTNLEDSIKTTNSFKYPPINKHGHDGSSIATKSNPYFFPINHDNILGKTSLIEELLALVTFSTGEFTYSQTTPTLQQLIDELTSTYPAIIPLLFSPTTKIKKIINEGEEEKKKEIPEVNENLLSTNNKISLKNGNLKEIFSDESTSDELMYKLVKTLVTKQPFHTRLKEIKKLSSQERAALQQLQQINFLCQIMQLLQSSLEQNKKSNEKPSDSLATFLSLLLSGDENVKKEKKELTEALQNLSDKEKKKLHKLLKENEWINNKSCKSSVQLSTFFNDNCPHEFPQNILFWLRQHEDELSPYSTKNNNFINN